MKTLDDLQITNIIYLEANINYTIYHLSDGSKLISSFTLKLHQETKKLASFLRINKSFLLNPIFIDNVEIEKTSFLVKLTNGQHFRSSRRKANILKVLTVN